MPRASSEPALPRTFHTGEGPSVPGKSQGSPSEGARSSVVLTEQPPQENAMYHPMLTFAVAQTRADDLIRDVRNHRARRLTAAESYDFDVAKHREGLTRRLTRYAAR